MGLGDAEREKRWEFGKVKLRVVNRCATLQPHTAFSKVAYVIINYTIVEVESMGLYLCRFVLDIWTDNEIRV